jgi:hypothetical protein
LFLNIKRQNDADICGEESISGDGERGYGENIPFTEEDKLFESYGQRIQEVYPNWKIKMVKKFALSTRKYLRV